VVGVTTAIFSFSGGSVGIGRPRRCGRLRHQQLISAGKVSRGYIGTLMQNVTPDIAEGMGLTGKGALVAEVTPAARPRRRA
jgi:serine protease Do